MCMNCLMDEVGEVVKKHEHVKKNSLTLLIRIKGVATTGTS